MIVRGQTSAAAIGMVAELVPCLHRAFEVFGARALLWNTHFKRRAMLFLLGFPAFLGGVSLFGVWCYFRAFFWLLCPSVFLAVPLSKANPKPVVVTQPRKAILSLPRAHPQPSGNPIEPTLNPSWRTNQPTAKPPDTGLKPTLHPRTQSQPWTQLKTTTPTSSQPYTGWNTGNNTSKTWILFSQSAFLLISANKGQQQSVGTCSGQVPNNHLGDLGPASQAERRSQGGKRQSRAAGPPFGWEISTPGGKSPKKDLQGDLLRAGASVPFFAWPEGHVLIWGLRDSGTQARQGSYETSWRLFPGPRLRHVRHVRVVCSVQFSQVGAPKCALVLGPRGWLNGRDSQPVWGLMRIPGPHDPG